jgi:catechol 2,3-dioxygenase-like lactoylglutathione lyase family enzyme
VIHIDRIDHLVIRVTDTDATCAFYERVLGMRPVTFGDGRRALAFGRQKINLHPAESDWRPRARDARPGSEGLCLVSDTPMNDIVAHLGRCQVDIELAPSERSGALGRMLSVYFRDPDGNLIEVSNYL